MAHRAGVLDTDAVLKAWLARFGRTVTDQVVDAVTERLEAPRRAGVSAALAGRTLPSWTLGDGAAPGAARVEEWRDGASVAEARVVAAAIRRWIDLSRLEQRNGAGGGPGFESRALTQNDFVTGTSFVLSARAGDAGGGFASVWGRGAISAFDRARKRPCAGRVGDDRADRRRLGVSPRVGLRG